MMGKLVTISKEAIVAYSGIIAVFARRYGDKPRKTKVNVVGVSGGIQTGHIPHTRQECYRLSQLARL
jgi:hypothetical protein